MAQIIIADTSCLISLHNAGILQILEELFSEVYTTSSIQSEFGQPLPHWIKLKNPKSSAQLFSLYAQLDKGEATAIALALQEENAIIIIDELKGRDIARNLGVRTTGTIGVLILAKEKGLLVELMKTIDTLVENGFRISKKLYNEINQDYNSGKS